MEILINFLKNSYLEENIMDIKVNEQTQRFYPAFDE